MKVKNQVQPGASQIQEFIKVEGAVMMVNLLKFREKAKYPDGRDPELSGKEAYHRYASVMKTLVEAAGGRFVFAADCKGLLLGEVEELWDQVGIVEYPSSKELLRIASSPDFQAIEEHRLAGLAGQLNITCSESAFG